MSGKPTEAALAALAAVLGGRLTPAQASAQYDISRHHLRRMMKRAGVPDGRTYEGKSFQWPTGGRRTK